MRHWIIPIDGMIYVIWSFDGSDLAWVYRGLRAQNIDAPIRREQFGICFDRGYC